MRPAFRPLVAGGSVTLALLSLGSCGGSDEGSKAPSDVSTAPGPAEGAGDEAATPESASSSRRRRDRGGSDDALVLLESEPVDSEEMGALHGEVLLAGEPPERYRIVPRASAECQHHPDSDPMNQDVVVADGKLAFVLVRIARGYDEARIPAPPAEPALLDQRGCVYTPHVLGIQAGRELAVRNSDPTTHNVNIRAPKNNEMGNVNMGQGQPPIVFDLERPEEVKFKCDIHPWMSSIVYVEEHPWFAVTGEDGRFRIPDVPPGRYTVEALHERYGKLRGEVEVEAGKSTGFSFTFE